MSLPPKYGTCFFERYAMYSLIAIFGEKFAGLVNTDRPDLQDVEKGIGIEVTRAISENKEVANSLINEMAGREVVEVDQEMIARINESGYSYGISPEMSIGSKEADYWALALPMQRILECKIRKVNDGFYGDFNEFELYIFIKEDMLADEVNEVIGFVTGIQQNLDFRYTHLYISQIDALFDCDLTTGDFDCYPIDTALRRKLYNLAVGVFD